MASSPLGWHLGRIHLTCAGGHTATTVCRSWPYPDAGPFDISKQACCDGLDLFAADVLMLATDRGFEACVATALFRGAGCDFVLAEQCVAAAGALQSSTVSHWRRSGELALVPLAFVRARCSHLVDQDVITVLWC